MRRLSKYNSNSRHPAGERWKRKRSKSKTYKISVWKGSWLDFEVGKGGCIGDMSKLFVYGVNERCPRDVLESEFGRWEATRAGFRPISLLWLASRYYRSVWRLVAFYHKNNSLAQNAWLSLFYVLHFVVGEKCTSVNANNKVFRIMEIPAQYGSGLTGN